MVSKSITVRFQKDLYHRIKDRDDCTSKLIRTAVKEHLNQLEENKENQEIKDDSSNTTKKDILESNTDVDSLYENYVESADKTFYLIEQLKEKMDQLNQEMKNII
ncbi:MAG: hypothetical protein V5A68_02505 [Candidatus Thermoplasmatota archaeon]